MKTDYPLIANDILTELIKSKGIFSWNTLTEFIQQLPYSRNHNRTDFSLVITENKGTCSSKHAFLKRMADLNNIPNISLIIGMYKMNAINTPKIGAVLTDNDLQWIPEAHCYLKMDGKRFDLTLANSNFQKIENDILDEIEINPEQVGNFKIEYHKEYLKNWLKSSSIKFNFNQIWTVRERCIEKLSE